MCIEKNTLICVLTGVFFSILFLQSGLDKVFNWKSELDFNKSHFAKSFLKNTVSLMLPVLTFLELSSGSLSLAGVIFTLKSGQTFLSFYAACLCSITLICLFFGQRIAKDYGGAQSLVSYFILSLAGVYFAY